MFGTKRQPPKRESPQFVTTWHSCKHPEGMTKCDGFPTRVIFSESHKHPDPLGLFDYAISGFSMIESLHCDQGTYWRKA